MDLRAIVSGLNDKGVAVAFVKENLTFSTNTSSPMNTLMLSMMAAFAEFERSMILEGQREGIAAAKAAGKATGRPERLKPADVEAIKARCAAGESKVVIPSEYKVSQGTLYAALKAQQPPKNSAWPN
jgi:DNA invertase Pin-like site-specific DNA recombinase